MGVVVGIEGGVFMGELMGGGGDWALNLFYFDGSYV